MFNAMKYIKNLEAVGFKREQAEAQVQLVFDAIEEDVATKSDIAEVREDFAKLRGEFAELKAELSSDFAKLRAEFFVFKNEIIFKLGSVLVGVLTLYTAIIGLLIKL